MKTIELDKKETWLIEGSDNKKAMVYSFSENIYEDQFVIIESKPSCKITFSIDQKIEAPNLKYIELTGERSSEICRNLFRNFKSQPSIEIFSFGGTRISEIPDYVLNAKELKELRFRSEPLLSKLPKELFSLFKLETLSFEYTKSITKIPDDIAQLINLKTFNLWSAELDYLSDQLFLLPKINYINFAYTTYTPSDAVLKAIDCFTERGGNTFGGFYKRDEDQ